MTPAGADLEYVRLANEALSEARDLINTPANDLGPAELGEAVQRLALEHEAECRIIVGEELLRQNYPLIYEVGKGSAREPRLIDMRWGKRGAPLVTLVGKGVCFDTGGLDIKPSSGMILMKKDMGGAALAMALARMLLGADAPVQLRLLIPAVENSVSGRSYRPRRCAAIAPGIDRGDRQYRRGGTAGARRCTHGSRSRTAGDAHRSGDPHRSCARGARPGTAGYLLEYRRELAEELRAIGEREADPMWPMPLWSGYDEDLSSRVADLNNVSRTAVRRLHHRRAVPQALRHALAQLAACRRVRMESPRNVPAGRWAPTRIPCARCTGLYASDLVESG